VGAGKKGTPEIVERAKKMRMNLLKPKARAGSITTTGMQMLPKRRRKVVGEVSRGPT